MNISVTKNQVSINTNYILNDKEYNVNKCYFSFSEEYTDDLVKKAVFIQGSSKIEMSIINNQCEIPSEVLNQGTFEIHVYAYEVDGENLVIRYSPTYDTAYVRAGSYVENTEDPEVITPTQFEQYMQAMNDGLNEVDNVDIDSEQLSNGTSVTITNRYGESKTTYVYNGQDGVDGADGKDAKINGVNTISIEAGENVTIDQTGNTLTINSTGGSGGTSDYTELTNKPKINNVELSGNKTTSDLGIVIPDMNNYYTKLEIDSITGDLDDLDTTVKDNLVNAINELAGGNVDLTDYKKIYIVSSTISLSDTTFNQYCQNILDDYFNDNQNSLLLVTGTSDGTVSLWAGIYSINSDRGTELWLYNSSLKTNFQKNNSTGETQIKDERFKIIIKYNSSHQKTSVNTTTSVENYSYYLSTTSNYTTPYTPLYDGSPATKKYVDDIVGDIETLLGGI